MEKSSLPKAKWNNAQLLSAQLRFRFFPSIYITEKSENLSLQRQNIQKYTDLFGIFLHICRNICTFAAQIDKCSIIGIFYSISYCI